MLLKDKAGLVTGAGEGIGRATAIMFAKDGARVAVVDRNKVLGEETAELIRNNGGETIFIEADVSSAEQVEMMVTQTVAAFGRLDCVSNNAARGSGFNQITETQEKNWDQTQAVTLKGVWLCLKYQIPAMLANGGGSIVNIASVSGMRGEVLQAPYAAAKGGVIALTQTAAAEYARHGIRINAVCPGGIRTRGMQDYLDKVPGALEKTVAVHAMRRLGEPEEIADAVCYLCSDRASFITGHSLVVDGGILVNPHLF